MIILKDDGNRKKEFCGLLESSSCNENKAAEECVRQNGLHILRSFYFCWFHSRGTYRLQNYAGWTFFFLDITFYSMRRVTFVCYKAWVHCCLSLSVNVRRFYILYFTCVVHSIRIVRLLSEITQVNWSLASVSISKLE